MSGAFIRGAPNYRTKPARAPWTGEMAVYHAMPHGLCDGLRRPVTPDCFVDITPVQETRRRALAQGCGGTPCLAQNHRTFIAL